VILLADADIFLPRVQLLPIGTLGHDLASNAVSPARTAGALRKASPPDRWM